jgi:hypothetical protein
MSSANATIEGDFYVYTSDVPAQYGDGTVHVETGLRVYGTTDSTSISTGAVQISGGVGVTKSVFVGDALTVVGWSQLKQTTINTTTGVFSVTGSGAYQIDVSASSYIKTSGGANTLTLDAQSGDLFLNGNSSVQVNSANGGISLDANGTSNFTTTGAYEIQIASTLGRALLTSGQTAADAVKLNASASGGGVDIVSGTGGFTAATTGAITMTAQHTASSISLATNGAAQDLSISVTGATDSSLFLTSSGTGVDALELATTAGSMVINSAAALAIDAAAAASHLSLATTGAAQDLTVSVTGATNSSLVLASSGTGTDALQVTTSAGGMVISSAAALAVDASGAASHLTLATTGDAQDLTVSVTGATNSSLVLSSTGTGTDALQVTTTAGGMTINSANALAIDAAAAASHLTLATTGAAQDLTISVTGATNSSLVLASSGTAADALQVTASAGGIQMTAATGGIVIDTSDTSAGIKIGGTAAVPVTIGNNISANNVVTIYGDLTVSGTTTFVNSQTVTVTDNILILNSSPVGSSDSGLLLKRYQSANNSGLGDVVQDTALATGTAQAGSATTITLAAGASASTDFYKGYWLKITSGTGSNQVRRIKAYNGTTKVATVYTTADETATPSVPVEGLDFATTPDNTSVYALYGTTYAAFAYKENTDYFRFIYTPLAPAYGGSFSSVKDGNLLVGNLSVTNTLNVDTINQYTSGAGVTIETVNIKAGAITNVSSINGAPAPSVTTVALLDNANTPVNIPTTTTSGAYMFLIKAVGNTNGSAGTFMASGTVTDGGQIATVTRVASTTNERIQMKWLAGGQPQLYHQNQKTGGTGATISYQVTIMSA